MDKHILIVDDNVHNIKIYQSKFESEGFRVSSGNSGKECVLSIQREVPDLILLDLMMPIHDGFSVLKVLRERKQFEKLPIIVFSAKDRDEDRRKAFEFGATDYLVKSRSTLNEVVNRVRLTLERKNNLNEVPHYRVAINEHLFDGMKLAHAYGFIAGLKCKSCSSKLILDLIPDLAHGNSNFVARFECPKCLNKANSNTLKLLVN